MSTRARRIAVTAACRALLLLLCGPRQAPAQTVVFSGFWSRVTPR